MASIQKIKSPLTGEISYRAQIRVRGVSTSETFPRKSEAVEWAGSTETAIREGKYFPHAAARRVTFAALAKGYTDNALGGFDPKQRATRIQQVMWWAKQFDGLSVADVTVAKIAEARDACADETFTRGKPRKDKATGEMIAPKEYKRSGATVNRYVAALSAAMAYAASEERQLIPSNPVESLNRKDEPRGRTRFLSDDERAALLAACAKSAWPALHALVLLAITSGARRGELTSLQWSAVDMERGRATVYETKNGEQRTLVIVGEALKALQALHAARETLPKDERSAYVFPNPSGHPGEFEFFDHYWHLALETAGINNFRFHDLRHTCASYLAAQKATLLEIADVLGHKTLAMVKRYSHLVDDHKVSVIERMTKAKGL